MVRQNRPAPAMVKALLKRGSEHRRASRFGGVAPVVCEPARTRRLRAHILTGESCLHDRQERDMKPSGMSVACFITMMVGSIHLCTTPAGASEEAVMLHVISDELQQEVRPQQKQWVHHRQITVQ